ncbi:carbohydrate ABC transporter permease [Paenibacillus cellulositrophicus]|uniref:Multiple sugar transport system permease protein n=1 Tax=Paenibacillus favisporus TaxID=221028 RepID=A0ABV2F288_9BACL|nr:MULTISPECIES: sugar ABC transporter permease [Paenibacillus]MEC0174876.1 sugar ABC transporter permease [Paenibacillus favisporus]OXL82592.1 ABC transporter permease [Paenibacillus sp. SSG-1]
MGKREGKWFYLFISPWLIGFIGLTLGPILFSIYMSFTDWDLFQSPHFIGFGNYKTLLTDDPLFWKSVGNTFFYALISIPVGMAISLWIAYYLNKKLKGITFFRILFYLPSVVPVVASSLLFIHLLAPTEGLINKGLAIFGIHGPAWLLDPHWVKPALIVMSLWGVGGGVVLLLAGMKGVPQELYEAAAIDGARSTQSFFHITFPMLTPVIFFNLVTGIIGALQTFAQVFITTAGGPDNSSQMVVPYLFQNAFQFYKMGYASSIAWVLFIMIMALTLLVFRSSALWVHYEEGKANE